MEKQSQEKAIMPTHVKWINHKGKKILCSSYRYKPAAESVPLIGMVREYILSLENPDLRVLMDVTGAEATRETQIEMRKSSVKLKPYINKLAVVGLSPVKRILLSAINKFSGIGARPFKNELEAREWLISDD